MGSINVMVHTHTHTNANTHTCATSSSMRASLPPLSYWGDILQLMRTHKHRQLYRPPRLNKVLHIWTRWKTISMKTPCSTAAPPPESVVKDTISNVQADSLQLLLLARLSLVVCLFVLSGCHTSPPDHLNLRPAFKLRKNLA